MSSSYPKKRSNKNNDFPEDEAAFKGTADANDTMDLFHRIPEDYRYDPLSAELKLDYLRSVLVQQAEK